MRVEKGCQELSPTVISLEYEPSNFYQVLYVLPLLREFMVQPSLMIVFPGINLYLVKGHHLTNTNDNFPQVLTYLARRHNLTSIN